jgi:hypothetical protein
MSAVSLAGAAVITSAAAMAVRRIGCVVEIKSVMAKSGSVVIKINGVMIKTVVTKTGRGGTGMVAM